MSRPDHLIVDCTTGEGRVLEMTAEEAVAHREAQAEAAAFQEPEPVDLLAEIRALRAEVDALKANP